MKAKRPERRRPFHRDLLWAALGLASIPLVASSASARTITVNTVADDDVANGNCTVREAVRAVNTRSAVDQCPGGDGSNDTVLLPSGTINLASALNMTASMTIRGSGFRRTYFNGGGKFIFAFQIGDAAGASAPEVTLSGVRITAFQQGGLFVQKRARLILSYTAIYNTGTTASTMGGGIRNEGFAAVSDVEISGGRSSRGGGICNMGTMNLSRVHIHDCHGEHGGAILNAGGKLNVYASTLNNNSVTVRGAAIDNTTLRPEGGGTLINPTAYFHGSTIANNSTDGSSCPGDDCGAISHLAGTLQITGSIVAQNKGAGSVTPARANCNGAIKSLGFNLMGESSSVQCAPLANGDFVGDPRLTTLNSTNGGQFGHGNLLIPAPGSVVLDRIPPGNPLCDIWDQRGISRKRASASCDVGAIERSGAAMVVADTSNLTAGEVALRTQLFNLGFDVASFDDDAISGSEAGGFSRLVVISESVSSGKVAAKYQGAKVGVVVMEPYIYDDMLMTNSVQETHFGAMAGQTQFVAASNSGLRMLGMLGSAGTLNATLLARTYGFGVPAGNGQTLATFPSNAGRASVFAFPTATAMAAGFFAPAPRVGIFPMVDAAADLIGDGYLLVNQAFLFAAGE